MSHAKERHQPTIYVPTKTLIPLQCVRIKNPNQNYSTLSWSNTMIGASNHPVIVHLVSRLIDH